MTQTHLFFCDYCGAANNAQATICCFCNHPLDEVETPVTSTTTGLATLPAGTVLKEHYRIVKPIGQGGMGTVYRAQDTALGQRAVAIKELVVTDASSQHAQEAIEAFTREATLLASLQHENLPSVFEHFTENGRWYMVMTFIQGQTLEDYLARTSNQKILLREVIEISKQLCSVLNYLHSQYPPIIFRDIKPANIMYTPDKHVYLIDFGVARRFKTGQKKDTVPFGSLGYAAPEQFGHAQTTPRSDVYSLGATLYELLTGYDPTSTPLKFPPLRSLAPAAPFKLVALLEQMLDADESKRPANMLIVEQRLREIDPVPWQATPLPAFTSNTVSAKKGLAKRGAWRAVVMISLLVITGLAAYSMGQSNASAGYQANAIATSEANSNYYYDNNAATQANLDATASASANATATVSAGPDAAATADQVAAHPDPYTPQGTLAVIDSLRQANAWQEESNPSEGGQCQFKQNSFQITQSPVNKFYNCDESTTFANFTVQVQMKIQAGNCGGIDLRDAYDNFQSYIFEVCADGTYSFYLYSSSVASGDLASNSSSKAIKQGQQNNTLAVVANGSQFDLYVNHKKIDSVTDISYSAGTIGLVADASNTSTTVNYQNVIIWTLP